MAVFICIPAYSEIITLTNGIVARGKIVKADAQGIRVEYSGGKTVYHRRQEVMKVEREDDPHLAEFVALRDKGDVAKAEVVLRRAIEAQPVDWLAERYRVELMELLLGGGRFAEAVSVYAKMMRANPDSAHFTRMPVPVFGSKENQGALKVVEAASRDAGPTAQHVWALQMLAGSILAAERKPDAAEAYLNALRTWTDPRAAHLVILLEAQMFIARGKHLEAAALLEKAIRSLPEALKPCAYYWLGTAYEKGGKHALAATAFLRVPLLFQNESPALQSECLYQGAVACQKAGLTEQAATLRRELAERFPLSFRALDRKRS